MLKNWPLRALPKTGTLASAYASPTEIEPASGLIPVPKNSESPDCRLSLGNAFSNSNSRYSAPNATSTSPAGKRHGEPRRLTAA